MEDDPLATDCDCGGHASRASLWGTPIFVEPAHVLPHQALVPALIGLGHAVATIGHFCNVAAGGLRPGLQPRLAAGRERSLAPRAPDAEIAWWFVPAAPDAYCSRRALSPDAHPRAGGHPGSLERKRCPAPARPPG
jgi:hypothetical protein